MSDHYFTHSFVENAPEQLEEGVLYISVEFATVMHLCCCGCGQEVVNPLSPLDWKMTYDGESITLSPSIGNWSFPCRSHYWIRKNKIKWAGDLSFEEISANRKKDQYFKSSSSDVEQKAPEIPFEDEHLNLTQKKSFFRTLLERFWLSKS